MSQRINESELLNKVARLKEKLAEHQQLSEVNWGALGTGAMNAVRGAGSAVTNALSTTGGKLAAGAALGAGALAAGQKLAGGGAAAPAGTTTAKSDPAVLKQQQDLIAKGAKIKADGIMGPATQAAMKQFAAPAAATSVDAAKAAGAAMNAPAAPVAAPAAPVAAPAAPVAAPADATAEKRTPAEIAASKDLLSANNAGDINAGLTPDDPRWQGPKPTVAAPAPAPAEAPPMTAESVTFKSDEFSRLVSLINYR